MPQNEQEFAVRGDHITLDALLKATGIAPSGGAAKVLITQGLVEVDGHIESRRACKLRVGQLVRLGESQVRLVGS